MADTATNYRIHNYEFYATNGGTSIYLTGDLNSPLSKEIKVTHDIGRAKTKASYWISEPNENGIYGQPTTAMFDVGHIRWSYGDLGNKKHFLIFEYRQDKKVLRIYYFKDFYPKNPKRYTINFIKQ